MRIDGAGSFMLLALATLAFLWIVAPFRSAIVWAIAASVLFSPLAHWLEGRLGGRRSLAALLSVAAMVLALIVPAIAAGTALVRQAGTLIAMKGGAARWCSSWKVARYWLISGIALRQSPCENLRVCRP